MELSETLFKEIVGVRPSTPIYEAGPEQRRHTRVAFGHRARIFPLLESAAGCGAPVLVRDLSLGGVGFQLYDEMSAGDEFVLQLMNQSGAFVHLQCMAQRCEPGGTGLVMFVVGATFELVLNEKQWQPPKVLQRGTLSMNHPQAPAKTQIVVPALELPETEPVDASRIRNRLGGGNTKLAERLAPSVTSEPEVILPPAALVRARSALFTQDARAEVVPVEVTPAEVVAVPAIAAAVTVAAETIVATNATDAVTPLVEPAIASVITQPAAIETAQPADDQTLSTFETQPAFEYADHYAAEAVLASLEVPIVEDVDALTPVQELAEQVLTAVDAIAAAPVDDTLTPLQQIAEHVIVTAETLDRDLVELEVAELTSIQRVAEQLIAAVETTPAEENPFDRQTPAAVVEALAPMADEPEPTLVDVAKVEATVADREAATVAPVLTAAAQAIALSDDPREEAVAPKLIASTDEVLSALRTTVTQPAATKPTPIAAPVAPATVSATMRQHGGQSEASIVVVVVPSSMFGLGQRTITVAAGGMDVTVSIAGDRVLTSVVQPTTMAFESSDSTFDLLAEVVDPADADLLAV